ncbi:MAG: hypothetical protein GX199_05230, partial [Firmicutes bacterium]|nr:hypothetical protein [Bacillota bacterium]
MKRLSIVFLALVIALGFAVIDGRKITFKFATVDPNALLTFSQWPPLPKHLLEDTDPVQAQ